MNEPDISKKQLELLRHTLGLNYKDEIYRNFFHCGPEEGEPDLLALKAAGLMDSKAAPAFCTPGDRTFFATEAGKAYAMARHVPKPDPTLWQLFKSSDMDSFLEFLDIEPPRYEVKHARSKDLDGLRDRSYVEINLMPLKTFYRMVSPRGQGDWFETKRDAKASYKADMKRRRVEARKARLLVEQIIESA